jgi:hypothetical protein
MGAGAAPGELRPLMDLRLRLCQAFAGSDIADRGD